MKERCKAVPIQICFTRVLGVPRRGHMSFDGCRRTLFGHPSNLALVLHCWTPILLQEASSRFRGWMPSMTGCSNVCTQLAGTF